MVVGWLILIPIADAFCEGQYGVLQISGALFYFAAFATSEQLWKFGQSVSSDQAD